VVNENNICHTANSFNEKCIFVGELFYCFIISSDSIRKMTLIIADNQDITRAGMIYISNRIFSSIKEVRTKNELIQQLSECPDAVTVLDYTLLDISADYLLILQERFKQVNWVLFSDSLSEDFIRRMAFSGKSFSIVLKDVAMDEIEDALRHARHSEQYICRQLATWLFAKEAKNGEEASPLTVTEKELLKAIALGKTTKEIAAERFLSVHTVMTHRKNIVRKLKVNNAHEATKYALRAGVLDTVEYYI
jgi:DNA-binding NarL/FixJ family response regulator